MVCSFYQYITETGESCISYTSSRHFLHPFLFQLMNTITYHIISSSWSSPSPLSFGKHSHTVHLSTTQLDSIHSTVQYLPHPLHYLQLLPLPYSPTFTPASHIHPTHSSLPHSHRPTIPQPSLLYGWLCKGCECK